jgi:hypothetical protein
MGCMPFHRQLGVKRHKFETILRLQNILIASAIQRIISYYPRGQGLGGGNTRDYLERGENVKQEVGPSRLVRHAGHMTE